MAIQKYSRRNRFLIQLFPDFDENEQFLVRIATQFLEHRAQSPNSSWKLSIQSLPNSNIHCRFLSEILTIFSLSLVIQIPVKQYQLNSRPVSNLRNNLALHAGGKWFGTGCSATRRDKRHGMACVVAERKKLFVYPLNFDPPVACHWQFVQCLLGRLSCRPVFG